MKLLSNKRRPAAGNPLLQAAEPVFVLLQCNAQGAQPPATDLATRVDAALSGFTDCARRLGADDASVQTAALLLHHVAEQAGFPARPAPSDRANDRAGTPAGAPSTSGTSSELLQFFACCADLVPLDQAPSETVAAPHPTVPSPSPGPANAIGHSLIAALPRPPALSPAAFPNEVDDRHRRHAPLWTVAAVIGGLLLATHTALEFALEASVEPLFVQLQYVGRPPESADGLPCSGTAPCDHNTAPGGPLVAAGE